MRTNVVMTGSAVAAGLVAVGAALARRGRREEAAPRWLAVTVNRPEIDRDALPEPLARLGDEVEVRTRPAPGGWGTELHVRPHATDEATRGRVRKALREAKAILETGEVMLADSPPTTKPGPAGRVLQAITRRGQEGGRL